MKKKTIIQSKEQLYKEKGIINSIYSNDDEQLFVHQNKVVAIVHRKKENIFFCVIGEKRISEMFDTIEDAIKDAERTDIERIMHMIGVVCEYYKKEEKINNLKVVSDEI